MRDIARIGSGAPSFCWHCNRQLQRAPGKGAGLFYFHLVRGPDGHEHRVHADCVDPAVAEGCKYLSAAKPLLERDIEKHLVERVKELGGEVRKVQWVGRVGAPDRVVMLPDRCGWNGYAVDAETIWVELKNPQTAKTFPANAHERAQHREHERMRAMGQRVVVIGTLEQVEELLA